MVAKRLGVRSPEPTERLFDFLAREEQGLTTVEYIIVLCLIAVVGFALWKQFGQTVEFKAKGATNVVNQLPSDASE